MMVALSGLVVYIAGYWIFVIVTLRHLKKTKSFAQKVPLLAFGFLYEKYQVCNVQTDLLANETLSKQLNFSFANQAQWYYFNVLSLIQRTVYVAISVLMLDYPDIQVG